MPQNLWNDAEAAQLPALDGLVYRSNLLGQDRTVVNVFGGNTSVKLPEIDHLGQAVEVLWVKGEREAASQLWMEALREYPDSKILIRAIDRFKP